MLERKLQIVTSTQHQKPKIIFPWTFFQFSYFSLIEFSFSKMTFSEAIAFKFMASKLYQCLVERFIGRSLIILDDN